MHKSRNKQRQNTFKSNNTSKMLRGRNEQNFNLDTLKTDDDNLDSFDSHSSALQDSMITEEINSLEDSKSSLAKEPISIMKLPNSKESIRDPKKPSNITIFPKRKVENPVLSKVRDFKKPVIKVVNFKINDND